MSLLAGCTADAESLSEVLAQLVGFVVGQAGAPVPHLVDLASPAGGRKPLLFDQPHVMARKAPWKQLGCRRAAFRRAPRRTDAELRAQVVDEVDFFGRRHGCSPANHLVDLPDPPFPRESLLADDVETVARETARRHGAAAWALGRREPRRPGRGAGTDNGSNGRQYDHHGLELAPHDVTLTP